MLTIDFFLVNFLIRHYKDVSREEESKEKLEERHNRETFTKELVYSLLSPEFNNITVSSVASSCPAKKPDPLKDFPKDTQKSKALTHSQQTHNKKQESELNNGEEIVVTRTSINQELLGADGGASGETHASVDSGGYRNAERLLRAKQCADVLTLDDDTRNINNTEQGSVS